MGLGVKFHPSKTPFICGPFILAPKVPFLCGNAEPKWNMMINSTKKKCCLTDWRWFTCIVVYHLGSSWLAAPMYWFIIAPLLSHLLEVASHLLSLRCNYFVGPNTLWEATIWFGKCPGAFCWVCLTPRQNLWLAIPGEFEKERYVSLTHKQIPKNTTADRYFRPYFVKTWINFESRKKQQVVGTFTSSICIQCGLDL